MPLRAWRGINLCALKLSSTRVETGGTHPSIWLVIMAAAIGAELVPIDPWAVDIQALSSSFPMTGSLSLDTQRGARL
jgi:hypothetical protein